MPHTESTFRPVRVVLPIALALAALASDRLAALPSRHDGPDWLASAEHAIAAREYRASRNDRGLQASNRAHNLRTYFEPAGVRVHDRTAPGEPELLALRLVALVRGGTEVLVPAGQVSSEGPRVEIRRPGLVEWYENASGGLEHGFTLTERPKGEGALALRLSLSSAQARSEGGDAAFLTSNGRRLRYAGLEVLDAAGTRVRAELHVRSPHELSIDVDDARAAYPLTVDPVLTAVPDAVLSSEQEFASLGGRGRAEGAGDVNGDGYDDVIVGAPGFDDGHNSEGAVFVFLGSATGIQGTTHANASAIIEGSQNQAHMGTSVAGAGDVNGDGYDDVIVGALFVDPITTLDHGAAFVYLGGPGGIKSGDPSTASSRLQGDVGTQMAGSVAGIGDVNGDGYDDVIVGAAAYGPSAPSPSGAAYVFLGGPLGIPNGGPATADTVLLGTGSAGFGSSVAAAGDVNDDAYADLIVGAPGYDAAGAGGAAFVYLGGASGIPDGGPSTADTVLLGGGPQGQMGTSAASAGDVNGDGYDDVIVGAPLLPTAPAGAGVAYIFHGGPTGIPSGSGSTANTRIQAYQTHPAGSSLGACVAGVGDTNGDGYADVMVGAPGYPPPSGAGAAFTFLGGPAGVPSGDTRLAAAVFQVAQASARVGAGVAGAGDVNGDGYGDAIVSTSSYDLNGTDAGAAFVFLGGIVKGDLDGDGRTDLLFRHQQAGSNTAWLMNGINAFAAAPITPDPVSLDWRIAGVGDFSGDWRSDLLFWNEATGGVEFWLMNGAARVGAAVPLAGAPLPPWKPSAVADFNHDRKPDLLWRNTATQKLTIWTMNGTTQQGTLVPLPDQAAHANWEVVAAQDWNRDGNTDLLWYNATSGKVVLWFMDAAVQRLAAQFTVPSAAGNSNWNVVAAGEYGVGPNGVAHSTDIVWRNSTSGSIVVWFMDLAGNKTAGLFTNPSAPGSNPTDWTIVGPR